MKVLLISLFISIVPLTAPSELDWGMHVNDINRSTIVSVSMNSIVTHEIVYGLHCSVDYTFDFSELNNEKLIEVNYYFKQLDKATVVNKYHDIKRKLITKYGSPSLYQKAWICDVLQYDKNSWGVAVAYNHLVYITKWNTEKYQIEYKLFGERGNIYMLLTIKRK